jgi:hypothetical protein
MMKADLSFEDAMVFRKSARRNLGGGLNRFRF